MGLITLTEAKQYLEITKVVAATDAVLEALILSVTDFMKNTALNRNLESTPYKQLYNGNGYESIQLDEFPIITVSKLSISLDNTNKEYDDLLTEGTEFFKGEGGFLELMDATFDEGQRNVYVEYTAGFAIIPGDIKDICKVLIAKRMQDVQGKRFGLTTKNIFDDSVSYETGGLSPDMKKVLKQYRKRPSSKGVDVTGWEAA